MKELEILKDEKFDMEVQGYCYCNGDCYHDDGSCDAILNIFIH